TRPNAGHQAGHACPRNSVEQSHVAGKPSEPRAGKREHAFAMAMALALSLPSSRRVGSVVHARIEHRGWTSGISHSMVSSPTFATEPRYASAVLGHVVGEAHGRGARPVICFDVHDGWLPLGDRAP